MTPSQGLSSASRSVAESPEAARRSLRAPCSERPSLLGGAVRRASIGTSLASITHPAQVVGVPDERMDEELVARLRLRAGAAKLDAVAMRSDMVILGGETIYPREVEECFAFGRPLQGSRSRPSPPDRPYAASRRRPSPLRSTPRPPVAKHDRVGAETGVAHYAVWHQLAGYRVLHRDPCGVREVHGLGSPPDVSSTFV